MDIAQNPFKIIVKTNSSKNQIMGYDTDRGAYRVSIKSKPENNRANIEIIKFFSRLLNNKVRIIKGLKNKEKVLKIG